MTKQYVDSQEFSTTLPKPAAKQYEPRDYAHVLKALAEGKPVYDRSNPSEEVSDHIALKHVAMGERPPEEFTTEKPRLEIAIDTPVWVKDGAIWLARHFAGYSEDGRPSFWANGMTSHSLRSDGYPARLACNEVSLGKPEGLK